ncbi:retropepsin-like aspartic protease, partial [Pseudomonas syringae]|uniref:retropepsin-like aspartic protease n=1 Tax=Pseudomonas syringae TaxID=317 RepID=UPI003F686DE9
MAEGVVKYRDPRKPIINVEIGNNHIIRSLLDLGASVNILPSYLYDRLGLPPIKPTSIVIQLADRTTRRCKGIVEDVFVRCQNFRYPVGFLLLDTD